MQRLAALLSVATFLAFALPLHCALAAEKADGRLAIKQQPDRLRVELDGKLWTEYVFKGAPRPYCYPLIGPGDAEMTRNWPMKDTPNEQHDHPHHRSFWFGHGDVNGTDFWAEGKGAGKIEHVDFTEVRSGADEAVIASRNRWVTVDGKPVCTDERKLRFLAPAQPDERVIDFEITIKASDGDVTFGDTKEGTMALRLAETMRLTGPVGHGHILNSAGQTDGSTWGKRAEWCDYTGPVGDKIVGITVFDHPKNPRYPTWWHVRDYGLFAANPFGKHDFEKLADKTAGDLKIASGGQVTFKYRFLLHAGQPDPKAIAAKYSDFTAGAKP